MGEGIVAAVYLVNSYSSAIEFKTPEEKWLDKPSDLLHLRVFGCISLCTPEWGKTRSLIYTYIYF